jgi:hypothetical protein
VVHYCFGDNEAANLLHSFMSEVLSWSYVSTCNMHNQPFLWITPRQLPAWQTFHRNAVQEACLRALYASNADEVVRASMHSLQSVPTEYISYTVKVFFTCALIE